MSCRQSFVSTIDHSSAKPGSEKEPSRFAHPTQALGKINSEYHVNEIFWVWCGNEERQEKSKKKDPAPSSRNANQAGRNTNAGTERLVDPEEKCRVR